MIPLKVYKINDKLVVHLPFEVIKQLGLQGDEEVDFFKFSDKAFLFAKKDEIAKLLGADLPQATKAPAASGQGPAATAQAPKDSGISQDEIAVLKKLDTLRYQERTEANVGELLDEVEKRILQALIDSKAVSLIRDGKSPTALYSISRDVYNKFLMRKKELITERKDEVPPKAQAREEPARTFRAAPTRGAGLVGIAAGLKNENIEKLEKQGFVVIQTEAEASGVSLALEESIRHGLVLGTRSFNKKFYIVMRSFFDANCGSVVKSLKDGPMKIDGVVKETGIEEDAALAILYLLAEQGDVSERRRDVFALT